MFFFRFSYSCILHKLVAMQKKRKKKKWKVTKSYKLLIN